jgi:MerR family transcriptional regulator, Zn(II)-responsive regulator of zntA
MKQSASAKVMQSSELARLAGVSTDALRYYERNRLLSPQRSSSGYRVFPPEALLRVRMIRGALSVGFSIKELGQIFSVRDKGGAPCHHVRKLGTEKLFEIESNIRNLQSKRRELKRTLVKWDDLLKRTEHGKRAGLLEVFADTKGRPS